MAGNKGRSNNTNRLKSQKTENMSVKDSNSNKENKETISEVKSNNSVKSGNTNDKTQSKSDKKVTGFEVFKWIVAVFFSICTLFMTITTFMFNKSNASLIIEYVDANYIEEKKTVEITFKREQGNIAKAFMADISDSGDYVFNKVIYPSNNKTFSVDLDVSDIDFSEYGKIEKNNSYGDLEPHNILFPAMKSFALVLFDYKDNLYIYYVAVRPCPIQAGEAYVKFSLYESDTGKLVQEDNIRTKNVSNWKPEVVFLDCTLISEKSIEKAMIDKFNDDEKGVAFAYDEDKGAYVSSYSLFTEDQTVTWPNGQTDQLIANIEVIHNEIDLNSDFDFIRNLPNEVLGKGD